MHGAKQEVAELLVRLDVDPLGFLQVKRKLF
jgi:hypothetical protein